MSGVIEGEVTPGFEPVRDAFTRNFAEGLEIGAAFSAWRGDEMIVDLWGGLADRDSGRPWQPDSLQVIFSGSKGITAICLWLLLDRGLLELEAPVCGYWPAFGKPEIFVRHILSHTARLPGIETPTRWEEMLDHRLMAQRLETQMPFADPRVGLTYHPVTYGWLCGELLRQIDGRTLGRFLAEEIAAPLDLDLWIGLPEAEEPRVTTLYGDGAWGRGSRNAIVPTAEQAAADPVYSAIWYNPPLFGPSFDRWNARSLHAAEMPGANAIASARSVAKLYGKLATGGAGLVSAPTIRRATAELADQIDLINGDRRRYAAGVNLQIETMEFGPPADAFGHGGAGGSVHGAWPTQGIGFSYAMNRLVDGPDPRAARLLAALYQAMDGKGPLAAVPASLALHDKGPALGHQLKAALIDQRIQWRGTRY